MMDRRWMLAGVGTCLGFGLRPVLANQPNVPLPLVRIALSPTCGCCKEWVAHLHANGFRTHVEEVQDINRRKVSARIPETFWSCHTAFVEGYFLEGHVPAEDIKRLLIARPVARGLAVPGMPVGSPGMEMADVARDKFQTLLVGMDHSASVWAEH